MTTIWNLYRAGIAAALSFMLFGGLVGGSFAAEAKQTSLNRILEAFEKIDVRSQDLEQDAVPMRARMERLAKEMAKAREQLASLAASGGTDAPRKRQALQARMTEIAAEYINQAFKLVGSTAGVISKNLADIAELAEEVRKSDVSEGGANKLHRRIQENIAAGRSMRGALVRLRDWARQDPNLRRRFQSLRRTTMTMDRRISINRARLAKRQIDGTDGAIRTRRQEALDQAVDRLADMYTEVMAEKEVLMDLRDDVAVAIQLGSLNATQTAAERAIPGSPKAPSTGLDSLKGMTDALGELNDSIFNEALPTVQPAAMPGQPPPAELELDGFTNF